MGDRLWTGKPSPYVTSQLGRLGLLRSVVYDLSNGAIFNDLERPLTWFSRSRHSLTLNISQTATDTATVTIEGE